MPPRPAKKSVGNYNKQIDEFLAQSTCPAGQQQILENEAK